MPADAEKINLEMHVELEALREKITKDAIVSLEEKIRKTLSIEIFEKELAELTGKVDKALAAEIYQKEYAYIEKKLEKVVSAEAFAIQYEAIEQKIDDVIEAHKELKKLVDEMKDSRNNQLINWGTAIIISLFSALGMLLIKIMLPIILPKLGQ